MGTYTVKAALSANNGEVIEKRVNISTYIPYDADTYKTITSITHENGQWAKCGGTSQTNKITRTDYLYSGSTLIKMSDSVTITAHGDGPRDTDICTTTFSGWEASDYKQAIAAWADGTLELVSTLVATKEEYEPYFRKSYTDSLTIIGETSLPTEYNPKISSFKVYRYGTGGEADPESKTVAASIKLAVDSLPEEEAAERSLTITYKQDAEPAYVGDGVKVTITDLISSMISGEVTVALGNAFDASHDYYFLMEFTIGEESSGWVRRTIPRASVPIHVSRTNIGVAIGQYSTASIDDDGTEHPMFECKYPAYFYGGIAYGAPDMSITYVEEKTAIGKWINGSTIYRKIFSGVSMNDDTSTLAVGDTIGTLINMYGSFVTSSGVIYPLNYYYGSSYHCTARFNDASTFRLHSSTDMTGFIVIEYVPA